MKLFKYFTSHHHKWRKYELSFNDHSYFVGHQCTRCGEEGYSVPLGANLFEEDLAD